MRQLTWLMFIVAFLMTERIVLAQDSVPMITLPVLPGEIEIPPDGEIPEDQCVLELNLPEGSRAEVNGHIRFYKKPVVVLDRMKGDSARPLNLMLRYPSGAGAVETTLLRGGTRVKISRLDPGERRPELVVQTGTMDVIDAEAPQPGYWRMLDTDRGVLVLRDMQTGWILRRYPEATEPAILCNDGRSIIARSLEHDIVALDMWTGRMLRKFGKCPFGTMKQSPDGMLLVTSANVYGNEPAVWDVMTGRKLRNLEGPNCRVHSVVPGFDGRTYVIGYHGTTVIYWDIETGKAVRQLHGPLEEILDLAISPDRRWLVVGYQNNEDLLEETILWDFRTGKEVRHFPAYYFGCVAFSPDSRSFMASFNDTKLWDVQTGKLARRFDWSADSFMNHPDGRTVVSQTRNNGPCTFRDSKTFEPIRKFDSAKSSIRRMAVSDDGRLLATGSSDGTVLLWDLEDGRKHRLLTGHTGRIESMAFSARGRSLLTGSFDRSAILWDIETGLPLQKFSHQRDVGAADLSADGQTVVTGVEYDDNQLSIWDAATGVRLRECDDIRLLAYPLALSPDDRTVVAKAGWPHRLGIWDVVTGKPLRYFEPEGVGAYVDVSCLRFTGDGRKLLTAGYKTVVVWDVETGRDLRVLSGLRDSPSSIAMSANGTWALAGSRDVAIWEFRTGLKLRSFEMPGVKFEELTFLRDDRMFSSVCSDGSVKFWSVDTGELLLSLYEFDGGKEWLAVTPTGLYDGTAGGLERVTYRIGEGLRVVSRHRFIGDYHRPGLIAEILRGERPLPLDGESK